MHRLSCECGFNWPHLGPSTRPLRLPPLTTPPSSESRARDNARAAAGDDDSSRRHTSNAVYLGRTIAPHLAVVVWQPPLWYARAARAWRSEGWMSVCACMVRCLTWALCFCLMCSADCASRALDHACTGCQRQVEAPRRCAQCEQRVSVSARSNWKGHNGWRCGRCRTNAYRESHASVASHRIEYSRVVSHLLVCL
jgi:hypothetical protein